MRPPPRLRLALRLALPLGVLVALAAPAPASAQAGGAPGKDPVAAAATAGTATGASEKAGPLALSVAPNPARVSARLQFAVAADAAVRLSVHDALGREVALLVDGPLPAGTHEAAVGVAGLAPGLYVAVLRAGTQRATRRLTVVR